MKVYVLVGKKDDQIWNDSVYTAKSAVEWAKEEKEDENPDATYEIQEFGVIKVEYRDWTFHEIKLVREQVEKQKNRDRLTPYTVIKLAEQLGRTRQSVQHVVNRLRKEVE